MSLGCSSSSISSSIYQKTAESTQPRPLCYSTGYRERPTYLVNASWGIWANQKDESNNYCWNQSKYS